MKILYGVILTKRKLVHYFDAHRITVVSSFPLGEVVRNRDATGKVAKWALELMGHDITYAPHMAIKSRVLTEFVAEWTETQLPVAPVDQEVRVMCFDGSLMKTGAGVGLIFISPHGVRMSYAVRMHFPASNNVVEYEAMVNGMRIAVELGIWHLEIRGDSQMVIAMGRAVHRLSNPTSRLVQAQDRGRR